MVDILLFHVVIGRVPGAGVCTHLAGLGPVRSLVGKVAKFMSLEALDLAEVLRIPLAIVGVHIAVGRVIVIILRKDNGAWRRTYAVAFRAVLPVENDVVHLGAGLRVLISPHQIFVQEVLDKFPVD